MGNQASLTVLLLFSFVVYGVDKQIRDKLKISLRFMLHCHPGC